MDDGRKEGRKERRKEVIVGAREQGSKRGKWKWEKGKGKGRKRRQAGRQCTDNECIYPHQPTDLLIDCSNDKSVGKIVSDVFLVNNEIGR